MQRRFVYRRGTSWYVAIAIHGKCEDEGVGQSVADAFIRIYGVDIKKAGVLNGVYLKVDKIG